MTASRPIPTAAPTGWVRSSRGRNTYSFAYNALGDRLRQTVNGTPTNYTVDLAAGLTQVLADGTKTHLYGVGRSGEEQPGGWLYNLGDALGSVRQLANAGAAVTLARSYEPFGDTMTSAGAGSTVWQFTGEARDGTGLTYLRARYYAPAQGIMLSRDPLLTGNSFRPKGNGFEYAYQNPVNRVDPSGLFSRMQIAESYGFREWNDLLFEMNRHSADHVGGTVYQMPIDPLAGGRWGFLALLLDALPGDRLQMGKAQLRMLRPAIEWSSSAAIGYDRANGTITIGGRRLRDFVLSELNGAIGVTWRDDTPHYYGLRGQGIGGGRGYIDASDWTELPDFRSLGVSFPLPQINLGASVSASADRFGNITLAVGVSRGPGAGVAYAEAYLGAVTRRLLLATEDPSFLEFCVELAVALRWGGGAGRCGSYGYTVHSEGVQVGGGLTGTAAFWIGKDNSLGWDWAVQDRRTRGTRFADTFGLPETPFDECNNGLLMRAINQR